MSRDKKELDLIRLRKGEKRLRSCLLSSRTVSVYVKKREVSPQSLAVALCETIQVHSNKSVASPLDTNVE